MTLEATLPQQRALVEALRRDWSVAGQAVELLETHISWVLLAGGHAYKIKKAVNFGFLDYSTLERRAHFCREELRLNRRTAPDLYLEAVPVVGSPQAPRLGAGEPIEWAVKMRRFEQEDLLDHRLARGELDRTQVEAIADALARFHAALPHAAAGTPFGAPEAVFRPIADNFPAIRNALGPEAAPPGLEQHAAWAAQRFAALRELIAARKDSGHVRECHGDLHLGNMVQQDGRVVAFDGIEFNDHLRWIDTANELAFTAMDLEARGHPELSRRLVNAYLERTGDYEAVPLLDFYKHYRALVRAKVAALRYAQTLPASAERRHALEELGAYLTLAGSYLHASPAGVVLTCGVTGSGKTRLAGRLSDQLGRAIRIRSDVERKRLFGLAAEERSGSGLDTGLYTAEATARTYARLRTLAALIVAADYVAVVDATFLRRADRAEFRRLARECGVAYIIVTVAAPVEELQRRVTARLARGRDASEADLDVLARQLAAQEALGAEEQAESLEIDTGAEVDIPALAEQVEQRLATGRTVS